MKRKVSPILLGTALLLSACGSRDEAGRGSGSEEYRAEIHSRQTALQALEGGTARADLLLKNKGKRDWNTTGPGPVFLSYHLLSETGEAKRQENPRTALPHPLKPGEKTEAAVEVRAPLEPGSYRVEFDLVREGVAWFKDGGSRTFSLPLVVEARSWPEDGAAPELAYGRQTGFVSAVPEFEKLRRLIRLTLDHNAVRFQGKTGTVEGFSAGAGYPQVWVRDAATIIPASRLYYPETFLSSWLEEHLGHGRADGSLEDWIDSLGRSDKNTVETDQEASAVQAAYQVFLLRGADWLKKKVDGTAVIDRLTRALSSVFENRFDPGLGLITGAHTADWGDVDSEDADQNAIYVDEKTRWTADIYDQSMGHEACLELASMLAALGRKDEAALWVRRAAGLRENTDRLLWQRDKGFYRVHVHLEPWEHDFEEADLFAMGGNAQAIVSGLTRPEQAIRIIETALSRQKEFGVTTLSGCLLPPYPAGFFKHPAVDEPYEYQNGGQWDWFGGRLIYAMFESGFSSRAKEKLLEIAKKNIANGGLFEWETREGAGRGSATYAGSAGSLAKALVEGYFGLKLGQNNLVLEPKLGADSGRVHFYFPAADLFLAYDYQPLPEERRIVFRYAGNSPHPVMVRVLILPAILGFPDRRAATEKTRVFLDGREIAFSWLSRHDDDFIVIDTDFRDRTLEIRAAPD